MIALPSIPLRASLVALRVSTALLILAHAVVRVANGSIPQFGRFLEEKGFPNGVAWVWAITVVELSASVLLLARRQVQWAALAQFAILATGIVLIHASNGWFVGEHGTGGMEYSVALMVMLLVVAAEDGERAQR